CKTGHAKIIVGFDLLSCYVRHAAEEDPWLDVCNAKLLQANSTKNKVARKNWALPMLATKKNFK
ncbi:hypothetical protein MAR_017499, partial [Mya arenaria]